MKRITILSILLFFIGSTLAAEPNQIVYQSTSPLSVANFSNDGKKILFIAKQPQQVIYQYDLQTKKLNVVYRLNSHRDDIVTLLAQVFANKNEVLFMGLNKQGDKSIYLLNNQRLTKVIQEKNTQLSQGYLLSNGDVVYLLHQHHKQRVYLYNPHHKNYQLIVDSNNTSLFDAISYFSAKHKNIVFHGALNNQKANYTFSGDRRYLQLSPTYHDTHLGSTNYLQLGNKAFVIFVAANDKLASGYYKHYNLFGNILKDGYNLPLVTTGQLSPHYLQSLYIIKRPVLDFYHDHFYFIFLASTAKFSQQFYLYAATVEDGQVRLLPFFEKGKVAKQKIKKFFIGDIALSHHAVAVTTLLANHHYAVVYKKLPQSEYVSLAMLQHSIHSQ